MEPIHIFYKELPTDENNIFVAKLAEKNKVESVKFKKSRKYVVTGLSINQDTGSTEVAITDIVRLETFSNLIQRLVKEKKEPDLDLAISNEETLETVISLQKKLKVEFLR